ncbi:MAG: ribonuclease VapC [Candidatus Altiarchaeota archaeon]|nr:ribonuclease VapC [Candidatus Altiarchaeota archaeon]
MKVLDASGILHSDMDFSDGGYFITNSVLQELVVGNARLMVDLGIRSGYITVRDPSVECIEQVRETAKETGDIQRLSPADMDVIALALEYKADIVSDDYNIQNVSRALKLRYYITAQDGIKEQYKWEKMCPSCGLKQGMEFDVCRVCGSKLRRVGKKL